MTICDRIKRKYIRLSKGQRKVAQFVVDNPIVVANNIASEVGRLAGVSESTVIRFCYAMDLSGFSELQEKMQEYLVEAGLVAEKKQPKNAKKDSAGAKAIVQKNIEGISKTFEVMDSNVFEGIVEAIHESKKIHIFGINEDAPAAAWLYNNLKSLREDVALMKDDAESIAQQLTLMDENSLLVVIALGEIDESMLAALNVAKIKKAKLVLLHNQQLSTRVPSIDIALKIAGQDDANFISAVEIFSVLYAIIESLIKQDEATYLQFRQSYEKAKLGENNKLSAII